MKGRDIRRALETAGKTQAELRRFLAQRLDKSVTPNSMSRLVNEGRKMSVEEASAIEEFFAGGADAFAAPEGVYTGMRRAGQVPLYGHVAAAGGDRIAFADGANIDWVNAPMNTIDAAFRVIDDSMEPRLFAGEIVFVKLGVPPARGGDVVIEFADEAQGAMIKTYLGSKDGKINFQQWNPARTISVAYDKVRAMHAVRLRG